MKSIDFSKPGGFPLTQDQLGYMQSAYTEALTALASVGGDGPIVISGIDITKTLVSGTTYTYSVTQGWVLYNAEMIKVPAGSITADTATNTVGLSVVRLSSTLTYNDGTTYNVVKDASCTLSSVPAGTPDGVDYFDLASLQKYGRESTPNTLAVNTLPADGGVTGSIFYRKNFLNNTLQLSAFLGCANAQNFVSAGAPVSVNLGIFPVEYRPNATVYFTGFPVSIYRLKDDLDVSWLETITCTLASNGTISAKFIRPQSSIVSYAFFFNVILPLD